MNAHDFIGILDEIKAGNKAEKERLIGTLLDEHYPYRERAIGLLDALLNPYRRFNLLIKPPKGEAAEREGRCALTGQSAGSHQDLWWVLERLENRTVTGNDARAMVDEFLFHCDGASHELLYRILKKDPRCGASASTFNKVSPGLIPEFNCPLAQPYEQKRVKSWPLLAEKKYDGMRVLIHVDVEKRTARPMSRNGKPVPSLDHLMDQVVAAGMHAQNHFIDCEAIGAPGTVFNDVISAVRGKSPAEGVELRVFAVVPEVDFLDGEHSTNAKVREHVQMIFGYTSTIPPFMKLSECWPAHDHDEVMELFGDQLEQGQEGLVLKQPDWPYECKRNYGWLKTKDVKEVDAPVIGIFEGEVGTKYEGMLGGIIVDVDGVQVRVGSGISDKQRKDWYENPSLIVDHVAQIKYHEKTPDGSLRHPRFDLIRKDKDADNPSTL